MDSISWREKKALEAAALGGNWEYRAKLGGDKTFAALLDRGWIAPFSDFNPSADKFSITEAGRAALGLPVSGGRQRDPRLKELPSRLREPKGRLDR